MEVRLFLRKQPQRTWDGLQQGTFHCHATPMISMSCFAVWSLAYLGRPRPLSTINSVGASLFTSLPSSPRESLSASYRWRNSSLYLRGSNERIEIEHGKMVLLIWNICAHRATSWILFLFWTSQYYHGTTFWQSEIVSSTLALKLQVVYCEHFYELIMFYFEEELFAVFPLKGPVKNLLLSLLVQTVLTWSGGI